MKTINSIPNHILIRIDTHSMGGFASAVKHHSISRCSMGCQDHSCYVCQRQPRPSFVALHWRHNDHDGVSNHQPHDCLLNRLFRRRSKKTSKLRVTGLCVGNSPGPVNSPHKGPVTRKMFPFDDVIMGCSLLTTTRINPSSILCFNNTPS